MVSKHALMIHGAGGGGWEWAIWRRVFEAAGWGVAAPDLGPPEPGAAALAAMSLADYQRQMRDAGAALGPAPVLVGASLGGLLAAALADELAARALVLVNPLPPAPWAALLPAREPYPAIMPWGREATLAGTRRALPDADDATCHYAWRRWRDESGAVLEAARAGVVLARPSCPVLVLASEADDEVPSAVSAALAEAWGASLTRLPGASHVGPLLGRSAARTAGLALAWLGAVPDR